MFYPDGSFKSDKELMRDAAQSDVGIFPDKKLVDFNYRDGADEIKRKQEYGSSKEISQEHAKWNFMGEYPNLPHAFVFMTDEHFGSVYTDQQLLDEHHQIIETTPNIGVIKGGDLVDAFNPFKHPSGMHSNAFPPDEQALYQLDKLKFLDGMNKLGAVQIGNHDDWFGVAGVRYQTFLRDLKCPIYGGEGILDIKVGGQEEYKIYWSHTHWGNSKLNITNAAKRAIQFNAPDADIALLGHTHQASAEVLDMAGKVKGAVVGGTYKQFDTYGKKWGMGYPGMPGRTIILYPDRHMFEIVREPETARQIILGAIALQQQSDRISDINERE